MYLVNFITYCIFTCVIVTFCAISVMANTMQWESLPLCITAANYGSVLGTYLNTCGLMCCISLCQTNDACLSSVYDDANGECSLNSGRRNPIPTCESNVKYARMFPLCVSAGNFRICHENLYGTDMIQGYVEVFVNGVWGTVCDDYWDIAGYNVNNVEVLCKSMGYSRGEVWNFGGAIDSIHTGPIVMDDVQCLGHETTLLDCSYISYHNCNHYEDVQVKCYIY